MPYFFANRLQVPVLHLLRPGAADLPPLRPDLAAQDGHKVAHLHSTKIDNFPNRIKIIFFSQDC